MAENFLFEVDENGVGRLSLNRVEVHNALDENLIHSLTKFFKKISQDKKLRVLILQGLGPSFCAGADLHWMRNSKNDGKAKNLKSSQNLRQLFLTLNQFPKPIIGKVHGLALGGGVGLVSVCDYVVAENAVQFGFTEVRLGLIPAVISPFAIAKIGESHARALFISGMRFSADRALQIGLIHEVVSPENLQARVEVVASEFLKAAPQASSVCKKLITDIIKNPKLHAKTCELIAKTRVGKEAQEGMSALLDKKNPSWIK